MWRTNDEMIRGLTRFSWVGGWVAFCCASAAFLLCVVSIALSNAIRPGILIAGLAGGPMIALLGRLQRIHDLREQRKLADQHVIDLQGRARTNDKKQVTRRSSQV